MPERPRPPYLDSNRLFEADGTMRPAAWDDIEHVTLAKAFLNDPGNFLHRL